MGADADIDRAIAAGTVPPFITAEFLKENRITSTTVSIVLMVALACAVVACRLLSRKFVAKRFGLGLDDGMAVLSLLALFPFTALCIVLVHSGGARHYAYYLFVLDDTHYVRFQIFDTVVQLGYLTALALCRLSGLAFYYRICSLHMEFLIAIGIIFGLITAGYIAQMGLIIFHCIPVSLIWNPITPDSGLQCLFWVEVFTSNSIISLICDCLLFGIPAVMLWVLKMPQKQKVQLASILLPGSGVVVISVFRLLAVQKNARQDEFSTDFAFSTRMSLEVAEVTATIVALSLPGVKPLFDRIILRKDDAGSAHSGSNTPKKRFSSTTGLSDMEQEPSSFKGLESRGSVGTNAGLGCGQGDMKKDGIYVTVDFCVESDEKKTKDATR
ncbi:protein related to integral membrane protein pth11 [Ophiocordyceps sinensis CO18]|nr:protein related to integral membrane protein pth11 [Ophiocordyceps sinensis CO18]